MLFYIVYIASIVILALQFTGFLTQHNLDWLVFSAAGAMVAVTLLAHLKVI